MEYITMIMSGLALLAATVSLIITLCEKKRSQKRNTDIFNYVEYECKAVKDVICLHAETYSAKLEGLARCVRHKSTELDELKGWFNEQSTKIDNLSTKVDILRKDIEDQSTKVDNLEKGIIPDYQEALAAKNSVDEFNRGLSAIMGYDPMEVARKAREERHYGGEVD